MWPRSGPKRLRKKARWGTTEGESRGLLPHLYLVTNCLENYSGRSRAVSDTVCNFLKCRHFFRRESHGHCDARCYHRAISQVTVVTTGSSVYHVEYDSFAISMARSFSCSSRKPRVLNPLAKVTQ